MNTIKHGNENSYLYKHRNDRGEMMKTFKTFKDWEKTTGMEHIHTVFKKCEICGNFFDDMKPVIEVEKNKLVHPDCVPTIAWIINSDVGNTFWYEILMLISLIGCRVIDLLEKNQKL